MKKNNHCLYMGTNCDYATPFGECIIGEQNCNRDVLNLSYEDFEEYLFYDFIEEEE